MTARIIFALAIASVCVGPSLRAAATQSIEIVPQTGHGSEVQHVAFSADGRLAISTSEDMTAKLWQLDSGQLLRTFRGHSAMVTWASFLPDGVHAVTTSFDHTAILWDIETGVIVRQFKGHSHIVWCADVSRDGRRLITAGYDETVRLWDVETGQQLHVFDHMFDFRWVRFSTDGRKALAINGMTLSELDLTTFTTREIERNGEHVRSATYSADGRAILTAGGDSNVRLWNAASGALIRTFTGHGGAVIWVGFGADGLPISCDYKGMLIHWAADGTRRSAQTIASGESGDLVREVSDDGAHAVILSREQFTAIGTTSPFARRMFSGYRQQIGALAVAGKSIIAMTDESEVHIWNMETSAHERMFVASRDHGIMVGQALLSVAPAARRLLTGHYGTAKLWDIDSGMLVREIRHGGMTEAVALAPDGKRGVVGGYDMPMVLWDFTTGKAIRRFPEQKGKLVAVAIAPDQQSFLAAADDLTVRHWRMDGTLLRTLPEARAAVHSIAFSADSKRALLFSDTRGQLVDLATGRMLREFPAHKRPGSVAWHPDGRHFLASGGTMLGTEEDTVRVWDSETGALQWEGHGHLGTVHAGTFSTDGKHLVTGAADGTLRIWQPDSKHSISLIASGEEWLIFRSDGFFDASRHGGELAAAVAGAHGYRIDQLAARYNRPDLVLEHAGLGTPELLAHYRARHALRLRRLGLSDNDVEQTLSSAPQLAISDLRVSDRTASVHLRFIAAAQPLIRYSIFVNGVPIFGPLGKPVEAGKSGADETLELAAGRNRIEASVSDAAGVESLRDFRVVDINGVAQPALFFIGFGVSKYTDPSLMLRYADRDATELAEYFRRTIPAFRAAHVKTFVNEKATVSAIREAKVLLRDAKVEDVVVVFFAGHGTYLPDAEAEYVLLTHESDRSRLRETAAPFELLESLFASTAARRRLLLIDACESGERDGQTELRLVAAGRSRGLIARTPRNLRPVTPPPPPRPYLLERDRYIYNDLARRTGAIVYSSSLGSELSFERADLRNGVFTSTLLRALLSPASDTDGDGSVTVEELRAFVSPTVTKLTSGLQHPTIDRDNADAVMAFPILPPVATVPKTRR